jgi:hypothetical protein
MEPKVASHAAPVAANVSATVYNHPLLQAQPAAKPGCKCSFLRPPRKFHATVGLWLAIFLGVHLSIGLTGISPHDYEGAVGLLHRSLAHLPGAVFLLVFLPMLLQASSGLYLLVKEGLRYEMKSCNRGGKLRYFLQRWSGLAILAFLLPHVGSMHGWWSSLASWVSASQSPSTASTGAPGGSAFVNTVARFHPWSAPAANSITVALLLVGTLGRVNTIAGPRRLGRN